VKTRTKACLIFVAIWYLYPICRFLEVTWDFVVISIDVIEKHIVKGEKGDR